MQFSLTWLKVINPLMTALLKSRFHRLVSRDIMLITFTGLRTGQQYTTPVSYVSYGKKVHCFTGMDYSWWRNLRGGARVTLRIRGQEKPGQAEAISDDDARIKRAMSEFFLRLPRDAVYYDVSLDVNGNPNPIELELAVPRAVLIEINLDSEV